MDKKKYLYMFIIILLLGIPAALITYLFIFLIDNLSLSIINYFADSLLIIIIPAIGGLLVGLILKYGNLSAKGHGVPLLLSTIKSEEKGLTESDLSSEGLATTFTVISGGSVGLVGPIIELTTGITDIVGRYLKFDLENYRILIGSGAAASFAAVFNTPFAGLVFSLEVIHKDWSLKNIFYTAIASFSGFYFINLLKPNYGYFFISELNIETLDIKQYIYLIVFTFIIAFIGWLFINLLLLNESTFSKLEIPLYIKPMLGGLMVGIIGYFFVDIMGSGSNIISNIENLDYRITILVAVLLLKIAATGFSIGSGGSGGLFGPMIFIGMISGIIAGKISLLFFPAFAISPLFLALCGLVGIFGGLIKAPISSIILVLELFYLPNLIIPLIIAGFVPFIVLNLLRIRSIYSPELFNKEL